MQASTLASQSVPFLDLASLHAGLEQPMLEAVGRVIRANNLILGPECQGFEAEFAAFCGAEHAVGVGNGLDALTLGLRALGIRAGDEVIVPGQTFIATWLAVSAVGAVPVPADVLFESGQIDPAAVEAAITSRTTAILAVHLFGSPAPLRQLAAIAEAHGLALIEDAAQAHGMESDGLRVGEISDYAAFSFYPGKNLGALGDAGLGVTRHAEVADRLRLLRNYGSRIKYEHEEVGTNSRLDELQAAVLRVKLPLLPQWNQHRRALAAAYRRRLVDTPGVRLPSCDHYDSAVFHLFPVLVANRDQVAAALTANGIGVGVHYPFTPHQSQAYQALSPRFELPNSVAWATTELSLPIGPTMPEAAVDVVVDALIAALSLRP